MVHHHEEIIKAWGCSSHGQYLEALASYLELPAPKVHSGGVAGVACLVGGVLVVASEGGQALYYGKGH